MEKDCRELLQKQLQEANRKAQEYRQQLLKKEQEAELYRLRLEAIAHGQTNGTSTAEESQEEEVVQEEDPADQGGLAGEEVVLSEGAIIIKTEELDPTEEEEMTLVETVETTSAHTEVTL